MQLNRLLTLTRMIKILCLVSQLAVSTAQLLYLSNECKTHEAKLIATCSCFRVSHDL